MTKSPDTPKKAKDPAKPTRSKATASTCRRSRPGLLTCSTPRSSAARPASDRDRPAAATRQFQGPARRRRGSHRARKSTPEGFSEASQAGYVGKTPVAPGSSMRGWRRRLRLPDGATRATARTRPRRQGVTPPPPSALERLLREGRREFLRDDGTPQVWTPHRPPRPEKSEGGVRFVIKSEFEPKGDQPQAIARAGRGRQAPRPHAGAARRHRLGQDLHHGQGDRGDAAARR